MRTTETLLASALLLLAGCGDNSSFTGQVGKSAQPGKSSDASPQPATTDAAGGGGKAATDASAAPAAVPKTDAAGAGGKPSVDAVAAGTPAPAIDAQASGIKGAVDQAQSQPPPCDLGYPFQSSNPRTNVDFSENEILVASSQVLGVGDILKAFYVDEHALTLGVSQVSVKGKVTNYPVSPLTAVPGSATSPQVGTTALTGDQAGIDTNTCADPVGCGRPIFPALFLTDITADATSTAGDWQNHGTPVPPTGVFGTWKAAVRTVDSSGKVSLQTDADPKQNGGNLGNGDTVPPNKNSGDDQQFTAEVQWQVAGLGLTTGHTYRAQFMLHDGDQNHGGGDAGQGCAIIRVQ